MLGNTNYAYVKLKDSKIIDIQEKKPFTDEPMSEYVSSGTHYFKSALIMKNTSKKQLKMILMLRENIITYYVLSYIKDNFKLILILNILCNGELCRYGRI